MEKPYGIYARVSTDDQNIEQSIVMLKNYAKALGLNIRTYNDFDISGTIPIFERPEGSKLINDLASGKLQGMIVPKWDRITRVLKHGIEFLEFWNIHKFKLRSIYEGEYDGSPNKEFIFKQLCLISEYELKQLKWRSQIGIERAKQEGKYKGRLTGSKNKK